LLLSLLYMARPWPLLFAGESRVEKAVQAVPASAADLVNPYESGMEAAMAGKKLYLRHCSRCHGREGQGIRDAVDLHSPALQNSPPGVLFWLLKNGNLKGGMPAWSRLPDPQLWEVVTYLKQLGKSRDSSQELAVEK